jgi:hypothetical protein
MTTTESVTEREQQALEQMRGNRPANPSCAQTGSRDHARAARRAPDRPVLDQYSLERP